MPRTGASGAGIRGARKLHYCFRMRAADRDGADSEAAVAGRPNRAAHRIDGGARGGYISLYRHGDRRVSLQEYTCMLGTEMSAHAADSSRYRHQNGLVRALALQGWLPVFAGTPLPAS
jgi:hypothetical protein